MASPTRRSADLTGLPVEIILDIYQHLDLNTIFKLSLANKSFFNFFQERKASILLPILVQEFSPFGELLQVYTASAEDIESSKGLYKPRKVIFKRFPGDSGLVMAPNPDLAAPFSAPPLNGFTPVVNGRKHVLSADSSLSTVILTERDLDPILRQCQLVRKWEDLFPQMRWFHEPENCRSLRPHESARFRRALYRWWLYGIYFHGDLPRPRVGFPEPNVTDIRTSQMRYHSTADLLELMDLVETMKDIVLHYICPRLDPTHQHSFDPPPLMDELDRGQSLSTSWNNQSRWGRIVKTYAKLGPEELLYYFDNIYSYPRKRLLTEIRLQRPNFTFDQESIQVAIRCALDERQWQDNVPSLAEDSAGGIVDFGDERDDERLQFGDDASPNGSLPIGSRPMQSHSRYSPRGDDGSCLEEHHRYSGFGGPRFVVPAFVGAVMQ